MASRVTLNLGASGSDLFDFPQNTLHLNDIAHLHRLLQHEDKATDKIVENILGTKTDRNRQGTTQKGKDG